MPHIHRFLLRVLSGALCSVTLVTPVPAQTVTSAHGLSMAAGHYRCELNRSVHVRHVTPDQQSAVLQWNRKDYTLRAVEARTGALRYEDPQSGLVWITITGKSMLLDSKHGKQLANECTT